MTNLQKPQKPKIFYLPGPYEFCYYVRGYLPAIYSGQMVADNFIGGGEFDSEKISAKAKSADIIVIQRPCDPKRQKIAETLKTMGKKVIFENDDTYKIPLARLENDRQREIALELDKHLVDTLKICDGAIASTEILAEEYRKINPNVVVLKNCIDPLDEFPKAENKTGKFRIGFIGSVLSNDDYYHIKDHIRELDARGDVTIVIMGIKQGNGNMMAGMKEDYEFWNSLKNTEWHPYVQVSAYMMTVASLALDLAIIPRKEHYFNQCKSNLKFLEMSLLKIPVLAQGFSDGTSPYQGLDEQYMTVIVDNSKWYENILKIKNEYPTYQALADKAHTYVLKNYNIEQYASKWTEEIINLVNKSEKNK